MKIGGLRFWGPLWGT